MPKSASEKSVEAEKLFNKGIPMVEIAKKLGVSDGTVRSWKNRYGWGDKSKKNKRNVANKKKKEDATLQKKRGAPKGNQNAKGGRGNPHPTPPPDVTKHGGYSAVYWDTLSEEEKAMIDDLTDDTEMQLIDQIKLYTVRERRIMTAINKYREQKGGVYTYGVTRSESKRIFKTPEDEELYHKMVQEKIDKGDRMPGDTYQMETVTSSTVDLVARLEKELTTVQSKKTQAIEALNRFRLENEKLNGGTSNNDLVKAWGEKLLAQRRGQSGEE